MLLCAVIHLPWRVEVGEGGKQTEHKNTEASVLRNMKPICKCCYDLVLDWGGKQMEKKIIPKYVKFFCVVLGQQPKNKKSNLTKNLKEKSTSLHIFGSIGVGKGTRINHFLSMTEFLNSLVIHCPGIR